MKRVGGGETIAASSHGHIWLYRAPQLGRDSKGPRPAGTHTQNEGEGKNADDSGTVERTSAHPLSIAQGCADIRHAAAMGEPSWSSSDSAAAGAVRVQSMPKQFRIGFWISTLRPTSWISTVGGGVALKASFQNATET
jgi:hypothetical protein